jgi:hypothetical protein
MSSGLVRFVPHTRYQHFLAPVLLAFPVHAWRCHFCGHWTHWARQSDHAADCELMLAVRSARGTGAGA